jgi:hypothetical protein
MGAVRFFSATSGIGITAENFPCFLRIKGGVGSVRESVRMASTSDGGASWHITGRIVPLGQISGGVNVEQVAATSPADVWALVGKSRLVATRDGGSDWQVPVLPRHVVQIATSDGVVWALACSHVRSSSGPSACQPELWRTRSPTSAWTRLALPPAVTEGPYVQFTATASDIVIALVKASSRPAGQLLVSHDAGARWTKEPPPVWDHKRCDEPAGLTASPPRTFWLLCLGGAAAGSSTKGLLRSTDAGRTWTTVSAVTTISQRRRRGSISLGEPSALAAGSQTRIWLSITNGLTESNDGGRRWADVPQAFDVGGWETVIDELSASHAWLLAPGAGMWRTTDGLTWHVVPPLNTG